MIANGSSAHNECVEWKLESPLHTFPAMFVIITLYSIVGILSLLGNISVIIMVIVNRELRSITTNIFIANLALGDLLITITSLWLAPLYTFSHGWIFGPFLCYLMSFVTCCVMLVASFTLAAIAIDRYLLIVHPFKRQMHWTLCLLTIVFIWVTAGAAVVPLLMHVQHQVILSRKLNCPRVDYSFCIDTLWDPDEIRILYGVCIFLLRTLVPFTIIAFCYITISRSLKQQFEKMMDRRSSLRRLEETERRQRLQGILITMVLIFGICSMPLDIMNLLKDIDWYLFQKPIITLKAKLILSTFVHLLAMTASLWNPMLYAWWSENFRRELIIMWSSCREASFRAYYQIRRLSNNLSQRTHTTFTYNSATERTNNNDLSQRVELLAACQLVSPAAGFSISPAKSAIKAAFISSAPNTRKPSPNHPGMRNGLHASADLILAETMEDKEKEQELKVVNTYKFLNQDTEL